MSTAPVISLIDDIPPTPQKFLSMAWYREKTCGQLLTLPGPLPSFTSDVRVTCNKPSKVYDSSDFHKFKKIPLPDEFAEIRSNVDTALALPNKENPPENSPKDCWIVVGDQALKQEELGALSQVSVVVRFIGELRAMDQWLKDKVRVFDPKFETRFRDLLDTSTNANPIFLFGQFLWIHDLLLFAGPKWLNDSGLDCILRFLQDKYDIQKPGRYLFIPAHQLRSWIELSTDPKLSESSLYNWGWERDVILRTYGKAYAIVHMEDHWGALSIDFEARAFAFGDSLGRGVPDRSINAVKQWLKKRLGDEEIRNWSETIEKLPVGKQTSGSCGVLAAAAIEADIGEKWLLNEDTDYLRARYLGLLTGLHEV
jgi:hypothetical protein